MKKIIMAVVLAVTLFGVIQNNIEKDVFVIDDYSYKVVYNTGREVIYTFDTELEMAETYTDKWYEIYE